MGNFFRDLELDSMRAVKNDKPVPVSLGKHMPYELLDFIIINNSVLLGKNCEQRKPVLKDRDPGGIPESHP